MLSKEPCLNYSVSMHSRTNLSNITHYPLCVIFMSCFLASLEDHSICTVSLNFMYLVNVRVTADSNISFEMLPRFDYDTVCRAMSS